MISDDSQLLELLCATLSHIGIIFSEQYKFELAIQAYKESSQVMANLHGEEYIELACTYANLGVCYERKEDLALSLEYLLKALELRQAGEAENHYTSAICKLYEKITFMYARKKDLESAK